MNATKEGEINHQLEDIKDLLEEKDELQKELQAATEYIAGLEEKCYQSNGTSLELLQKVRDLEAEVEQY